VPRAAEKWDENGVRPILMGGKGTWTQRHSRRKKQELISGGALGDIRRGYEEERYDYMKKKGKEETPCARRKRDPSFSMEGIPTKRKWKWNADPHGLPRKEGRQTYLQ